ncbi:MAG: peptidoglycan DD-metalloendopeptidase family protein [Lachnospiraceae bacterium]|nr:peptidoglycan DD-metalloendopeptidase family protein [Lachnospiraceae bacterium]
MKRLKSRIFSVLLAAVIAAGLFMDVTVYAQNVEEETAVMEEQSRGVTLVWPVPGHTRISQGFHDGKAIDIADGSITGAPVVAAMGGIVTNIFLCGNTHHNYGDCNGFGTGLVIKGDDGRFYQYAHMQAGSIPPEAYRTCRVEAGQQIGRVGSTGFAYGAHLHFGISTGTYWNESGINPQNETYIYNNTPTPVTMGWENDECQPGDTNARIALRAVANVKGTFTQTGAVVWDASGAEAASKTENINTPSSYLNIWYDITGEMGVALKSGSAYTYQFFVVFNGTRYTSPVKSFSTTGQTIPVPVLSLAWENGECQPGETDAHIAAKAVANMQGTFTQTGVVIWDESGAEAASKTEDINTKSSYLNVWYDVTAEMGAVLKPGSGYTYQFFVVFDGNRYESGVNSFQTLPASGQPTVPANPEEPANPDNPGSPENPAEPDNPGSPEAPENPSNPTEPSNPGKPSDPDDPGEDECAHDYSEWETISEATVFDAEEQERYCSLCGDIEFCTVGAPLTPAIRLSTTDVRLKTRQSATVKVSGLASGDYVAGWRTSNRNVAVVSSTGKITAKSKTGSAVVTVTLASGKTARVKVKVQKSAVQTTKISGLKKSITLKVKGRTTLRPVISPSASTQKVTYKSSNKKVVTVTAGGKVTAKKRGRAVITVKSGKKSVKVSVRVK